MKKISTEDDISAIIGKLAIQVTFARESEILETMKEKRSTKV